MTEARLSLILAALLVALAVVSLLTGDVPLGELSRRDPRLAWEIFAELRLPRMLLAVMVGATLGLAGAALQGYLRNPLASPDVIGASAGAALGAIVTAYYLGLAGTLAMALGGIAGALIALITLLLLASKGATTTTLILAGVAIASLSAAMTNVALTFAPSPFAVYDIMFWLLGSFTDRSAVHLVVGVPPMLVGGALILTTRRGLDALVLGEDVAASLGIDVPGLRRRIVAGSAIAIGGGVAVAGVIGFIGLVVPHIVRGITGGRPGSALIPSALGGGALLTAADLMTRLPVGGQTLPIGVVTSLVGAPFFLHLVLTRRGA